SWELRSHSLSMTAPLHAPLVSYPKAWSPGTGGMITAEAVWFHPSTDSALESYRDRLGGRIVLFGEPDRVEPRFEPYATRMADEALLDLANAGPPAGPLPREGPGEEIRRRAALLEYRSWRLMEEEGALAVLTSGGRDGGNISVGAAHTAQHPDTPLARRVKPFERRAMRMLPQAAVAAEHYGRLCRMMERGARVTLRMNLEVESRPADSAWNVIAEIPGGDLKEEIVMIGAHLDSWHGGTGATDNGTGVAACMEALRILRMLPSRPRRTIRIALWTGEEQGLFGSRSYVRRHLARQEAGDSGAVLLHSREAKRFSVYFNHDNGTGRIRGVYLQGNEAVRPIFRAWLEPFGDMGASTLSLAATTGSDHVAFDLAGLPAFDFIQDDIEYGTRTWHSTMDLSERVIEEDLKQSAVVLASFAWHAAMRDGLIPRTVRPAAVLEEWTR
ncbi:MAG: M20/M25/M40 family metallo-hydrolase, partial [Bacteroidota bacterium]